MARGYPAGDLRRKCRHVRALAAHCATATEEPLHGVTLEQIVTQLAEHYGWAGLGERIALRCFTSEPSVASSLKFLRKTPWAREKVEGLYLFMLREQRRAR